MPIEFRLPELGENIEEAEIAEVLVKEGDRIEAEQSVMELETEKAVLELPCPHAGVVTKIHVSEGDSIKVGAVILTIDESDAAPSGDAGSTAKTEDPSPPESPTPPKTAASPAAASPPPVMQPVMTSTIPSAMEAVAPDHRPPPPAGPATRRFARKLGVDLHEVQGTGPGGRIVHEDVEGYVKNRLQSVASTAAVRTAPPLPDFSQFGPIERQRVSKLGRTAAEQLSTSWQLIPHVTQHDLADITALERVRKEYLTTAGKGGPKITLTAIALKACVQILTEMPFVNSSLDVESGELILKKYYHIGVAVDTEHGLVVPVIRDADRKSIMEIADELAQLAEKARERKLVLAEMQGATFTITNLGGIGGTGFTPIVNYPEVAILGLSRSYHQPAIVDGKLEERLKLPISLVVRPSGDQRCGRGEVCRATVRPARTAVRTVGQRMTAMCRIFENNTISLTSDFVVSAAD